MFNFNLRYVMAVRQSRRKREVRVEILNSSHKYNASRARFEFLHDCFRDITIAVNLSL